ncbi:MAG: hypothetical protein Q8K04_09200 [Lutibacter sp.]|nr:hypothetical protein [Lutibacter sp.]MDP3944732.1 hypothetical protein [Lutibacter sp.]
MKKIIQITLKQIQQKTTQIVLIGLIMLFVMLSSLYILFTAFTSI